MNSSTGSANPNPCTPAVVEPEFVADVELDLSGVRSRITDMNMDSQNIVTDLLAALAPLHRHVVDVIDLSRSDSSTGEAVSQPLLAFTPAR